MQVYPQGKMSQCMERLAVGDTLRFKGPRGRFKYQPMMKKAIGEPSSICTTHRSNCYPTL